MSASPGSNRHVQRFDVIISGGGFAGLALARALSVSLGASMRIAVLDRQPAGAAPGAMGDGRALALAAGSRHLLDTLGVWDSLATHAEPVTGIEITDSALEHARRPTLLSYDNRIAGGEPATHIIENARLHTALQRAIEVSSGVSLLAPAETRGFAATDAGVVVTLTDGRSLAASLLVAADGGGSLLREAAGIKVVAWDYGQVGIVTTIAHERPHAGRAVQHFLPGGPFALLPLPGNRSCVTWSEAVEPGRAIMMLDDAGFLAEVQKRVGHRLGDIALAGPRRSWPLAMHLARTYVAHRLALVGDAAHGVHPLAGQGLNLAFRDVAALAEVVSETARLGIDIGSGEALERYERWRRPDSAMSAAAFDGLNRLFSNDWAMLRGMRDAGLGLVDRMPGLKQLLVTEAAGLAGDVPRLLKGEAI